MNPEDVKKLLGGYATGTLTADEQKVLFEAALQDQELFAALADEQALKEMLDDSANRAELLRALDATPERSWLWRWAPAFGALTVVILVAALALLRGPHVGNVDMARVVQPELRAVNPTPQDSTSRSVPPPESFADRTTGNAKPRRVDSAQPREPAKTVAKREVEQTPAAVAREFSLKKADEPVAAPVPSPPPQAPSVEVTAQSGAVATEASQVVSQVPLRDLPVAPRAAASVNELLDAGPVLSADATQKGVRLQCAVLRRSPGGEFRPVNASTTFQPGESVRLQITSNANGMVTVFGGVGGVKAPLFSGIASAGGTMVVPVQLESKDTTVQIAFSPGAQLLAKRTVSGAPPVFGQAVVPGGEVRKTAPATKQKRLAADAVKEADAKDTHPSSSSPLTLELTLKVQ